jgi:hypothetical protein
VHFHLPKPLHGWRELAQEIAVIVVGVLIALGAEQLVEAWTWREHVHVAERAMRVELLADDGPELYQRAAMHPCVQRQLDRIRAAVEGGQNRGAVAALVDGFQLQINSYDSLAHQEADASQVAGHMPEEARSLFDKSYSEMPLMDRTNSQESVDLARLHAFRRSGGALSDAESTELLQAVEALRNDDMIMWNGALWMLPLLRQLGPLDRNRVNLFMRIGSHMYGGCAKPLPAIFP